MQNEFLTYLQLGFEHVTDLAGYDHMLFVIGLCAALQPSAWKRVLLLITAFTLGHCITLILAGLQGHQFSSDLIEAIVAFSIFLAGAGNLYWLWRKQSRNFTVYYVLTFLFGLVHGLAFSNFFRALGSEPGEIFRQLLAFNIGVEVGQLSTVLWFFLLYLILSTPFSKWLGKDEATETDVFHKYWNLVVSSLVAIAGLYLFSGRI